MTFQWVDLFILGVILLSTVTGLFRGFIKEIIAILVWIIGIWFAYSHSQDISPWFQTYIQDKTIRTVLSFILILCAVLIIGGIFNAVLHFILKSTGLKGIDRFLGMIFGSIRGIIIVALMITFIEMTSIPYHTYTKHSILYPKFKPLVTWLKHLMPRQISSPKEPDSEFVYEA